MAFEPKCKRCGSQRLRWRWQHCRNGAVHLRADCADCGSFVGFAPQSAWRHVVAPEPLKNTDVQDA